MPRLVVVIPCYKQALLLPEAVESVCSQTYGDLEIVIVDDGSPDDTADVARRLAAERPERRIRLLQGHDRGPAASRNRAIEVTDAEYILPLDADDKIGPEFAERCVAALDRNPGVSIAYGDQQHFGADDIFYPAGAYDFVRLVHVNSISTASMFRRRAWEDVNGYCERLFWRYGAGYEDWDFWVGCAEHGHFGMPVPKAVFHYRVSTGSLTNRMGRADDQRYKAHVVLNHPVLYSPEQTSWARGVIDADPRALMIDGPPNQVPVLGDIPLRPVRSGGTIEGARRFATVAVAEELLEEPRLLRAYARTFSGGDDATLVVYGSPEQFELLGELLASLGINGSDDADLLGVSVEDPGTAFVKAASMVDALLTCRARSLPVPLPRVDDVRVPELRRHVHPLFSDTESRQEPCLDTSG